MSVTPTPEFQSLKEVFEWILGRAQYHAKEDTVSISFDTQEQASLVWRSMKEELKPLKAKRTEVRLILGKGDYRCEIAPRGRRGNAATVAVVDNTNSESKEAEDENSVVAERSVSGSAAHATVSDSEDENSVAERSLSKSAARETSSIGQEKSDEVFSKSKWEKHFFLKWLKTMTAHAESPEYLKYKKELEQMEELA